MMNQSLNRKDKFFLSIPVIVVLSVFISAVNINAQDSTGGVTNKPDQKDKKKQPVKAPEKQPADSLKALKTNEDPSQIGKRNINGGTDKLFGWFGGSKEKEAALGRQIAMEVEQQSKMVDDPMITEYVNRVGQNIALHSDVKFPVTIKVIDSDEVNAFALPGGYLFVNKGLLLAADNEDELAGVMAHELGHVAARHAMENQGKGQLMQYGMLAGVIFGGPIIGNVLYNGGGLIQGLAGLKFSRSAEEEADRLGVQYLYAAGYDPLGMAQMFEKLASQNKKKTKGVAKLLMDHPDSLDRRDTSLALVARFPEREEYIISSSEFQKVKEHLMRLLNTKAGITTDVDDDSGKPTLKRRQPEPDTDDSNDTSSSNSSSEAPPKLKRRSDPEPSPATEKPVKDN